MSMFEVGVEYIILPRDHAHISRLERTDTWKIHFWDTSVHPPNSTELRGWEFVTASAWEESKSELLKVMSFSIKKKKKKNTLTTKIPLLTDCCVFFPTFLEIPNLRPLQGFGCYQGWCCPSQEKCLWNFHVKLCRIYFLAKQQLLFPLWHKTLK